MAKQNDDLRERQKLLKELNALEKKTGADTTKISSDRARSQASITQAIREERRELVNLEGTASSLFERVKAIASEFKGQTTELGRSRSAMRQITNAAEKLKDVESGIADMSLIQLQSLRQKVVLQDEHARTAADNIISQHTSIDLDKQLNDFRNANFATLDTALERIMPQLQDQSDETRAIIALEIERRGIFGDHINITKELLNKTEEQIQLQLRINKAMGLSGAALEGVGGLMTKLGISSSQVQDILKVTTEEMREAAKEGNKLQVALIGAKGAAKAIGAALTDPLVILGNIFKAFLEVNKAQTAFQRQTGRTDTNFASLNTNLASAAQTIEFAAEATRKLGMLSTSVFSKEDLSRLAEAKNLLGLSSDEAIQIGRLSKTFGGNVDTFNDNIYNSVSAFNTLNDSIVSPHDVMKDVLNVSDDIALSLGNSPIALSEAASAARKLGIDLSKVNSIADKLMDFESSIESELEAQLLTGKHIRLGKARELALNNDLAGLAQELSKQGASALEFANMNRIQQNAISQAMGMSRQEMAEMLINQSQGLNLTAKQKAAARGITVEASEALDIQTKLNLMVSKLAQSFSPVLEVLIPIVDVLGSMIKPLAYAIAKSIEFIDSFANGFGGPVVGAVLLFGRSLIMLPFKAVGLLFTKLAGGISLFSKKIIAGSANLLGFSAAQNTATTSSRLFGSSFALSAQAIAAGLATFANPATAGGIGVITLGILGIGLALRLAAPAIKAFGTVITSVFNGIATIIPLVAKEFNNFLDGMSLEKLGFLYFIGPALMATGAGLMVFAGQLLVAAPALLLALPLLKSISTLAPDLLSVGTSLTTIAAGIGLVASALNQLDTEKLDELQGLVITTSLAAPMLTATGAITDLITGITGDNEETSNDNVIRELQQLKAVMKNKSFDVYLDGDKVQAALAKNPGLG